MNCDVLLMIGTDFPFQQFFPREATIVQIDVRGELLGRRAKLDATRRRLEPRFVNNHHRRVVSDRRRTSPWFFQWVA